jgi:flagellar biosynthesis protein FliQ
VTSDEIVRLVSESLYLALWISAPVLATALAIGIATSVLSAATQVQEQSLGFVPKLVGVSLVLALAGAWMAAQVIGFTDRLWSAIPSLVS